MEEDALGRTMFRSQDEAGDDVLSVAPGQYVCDFCTTPDPTWAHPCADMGIVGHQSISRSDDPWSACDECHTLIVAEEWDQLVERMLLIQRSREIKFGWVAPPLDIHREALKVNVRNFAEARNGDPWRADPKTGLPLESNR